MKVDAFDNYDGAFELMSDEEANDFIGYPDEKCKNVRVVENGPVRIRIQALFKYKRSTVVIEYTIPKHDAYIDVDITLYSCDVNKMIKYNINTCLRGRPYGQTAFGKEIMRNNGHECVYQKWCGISSADANVYVINKGIYGGSFTDKEINLSLLRTSIYAAHPIEERQIAPHDRFLNHIDMGERHFSFRITDEENIEREAQIYNEYPRLISLFPSVKGNKKDSVIKIENPDIILSSARKCYDYYEVNLYNSTGHYIETDIIILPVDKRLKVKFEKYELKKIRF